MGSVSGDVVGNKRLESVGYTLRRGPLGKRVEELIEQGVPLLKLHFGNPGAFDLNPSPSVVAAVRDHLGESFAYSEHRGLPEARIALRKRYARLAGVDIPISSIFIGDGVSELAVMTMCALLNPGDEVLLPRPVYPLWTAAVSLAGGVPVYYDCLPEAQFLPSLEQLIALAASRTRAIVIINPNNPTGVVLPEQLQKELVTFAESTNGGLVIFADEVYDGLLYDNTKHTPFSSLVIGTVCASFGSLSKVHRACGLRVGWCAFSGNLESAAPYLEKVELLSTIRHCSNVPGHHALIAALQDEDSASSLTAPGGRLFESRKAVLDAIEGCPHLTVQPPLGAMFAYIGVVGIPDFDIDQFALDLLEKEHVVVTPCSSYNACRKDYFRITLVPDACTLSEALTKIKRLVAEYATGTLA